MFKLFNNAMSSSSVNYHSNGHSSCELSLDFVDALAHTDHAIIKNPITSVFLRQAHNLTRLSDGRDRGA